MEQLHKFTGTLETKLCLFIELCNFFFFENFQ